MKVMLLAAGLGTRLKPLTLKKPKPLIPVNSIPLIFYNLALLKKYNFSEVIINLFYLGDQIEKILGDGKKFGFQIYYSKEPEILGTAGGMKFAEKYFKDEDLLIMNSDIIHDIDMKNLIDQHQKSKNIASLVVKNLLPNQNFSPLSIDKHDQIVSILDQPQEFPDYRKTFFTGIHVLSKNICDLINENYPQCIIKDLYIPQLQQGQTLGAVLESGYWNDLGTIDRLKNTEKELQEGKIKLSYNNYLEDFKKILDDNSSTRLE